MAFSLFVSGFPSGFGSAFFQFSLERLSSFGSYAWHEVKQIWGVEDELRKLHRTMLRVQDMMDRVSPLTLMGGSGAWKKCLADTKHCSYDADALVDYIYLRIPTSCFVRPGEVRKKILSSYDLTLPHDINLVQNKLENLETEINRLLTNEEMKNSSNLMSQLTQKFLSASSLIDEKTVVGRATDKQGCLDLLNLEPGMGNFSVISLVGMAGIGKTTLAQLVYGDSISFQKKMWVSVTMEFDVIKITKSIIEELTGISCTKSDLNSVQLDLQHAIRGFQFLLVLDDYWSEKPDNWDLLSFPLRFGSNGSKVIVTTRSAKVSAAIKSFETYHLKHLSADECWDLMKKKMHIPVDEVENLEPIGREIAKKCRGLPLAAKTLGSLLSISKFKANEWSCVLKSKLWNLQEDHDDIFPALMRSYIILSPQLQKCFAYCSLFPKDHEFEVEELVLLWMAEGFIQPREGWRLEDLGHQYFDDLCSRSFFQNVTNSTNPSRYKMHDLIHDMAQLVSIDICFQVMNMSGSYPLFGDACHLSMLLDSMIIHLKASQKNERLRTFLMNNKSRATEGQLSIDLFTYLRSLRVLDLSRLGLTKLTNSIDCLKSLRYLNLSENQISKLPISVCNLAALQTLKLKNCEELHELPKETMNLSSLRHLDLDIKGQLSQMPPHFGTLTNLQSLSAFIVGIQEENGIAQIGNMDLLRGSLCIKNIQVVDVGGATQAKLSNKAFLDKLELQWEPFTSGPQQNTEQQGLVLSNLRPHENLKELVIDKYCGTIYPPWICEPPNRKVTSIHLQGLMYCESLPPLGQLHYLKSFYISDMPLLKSMDNRFYGDSSNSVKFPSLESFEIRSMSGLSTWEYAATFAAMPLLNVFTIHDCPTLTSIPTNLRSHRGASISECPNL